MKKYIFIFVVGLFLTQFVSAQIDLRFVSGNQEMLFKTIDSSLVIIRQEYVIQTTTKDSLRFGFDGKAYFGKTYSLAVIANGKLYCDNNILKPWVNDPNFVEFKEVDTLKPVLSKTYIRYINQTKFTEILFDSVLFESTATDSTEDKSDVTMFYPKNILSGLKIVNTQLSDGWLFVAYSDQDISLNDTALIKWSIYKEKPEFSANGKSGKIKNPTITGKIVGGVFINPIYSIGNVEFRLGGILRKRTLNWVVCSITSKNDDLFPPKNEDKTLTPIGKPVNDSKGKKGRKQ